MTLGSCKLGWLFDEPGALSPGFGVSSGPGFGSGLSPGLPGFWSFSRVCSLPGIRSLFNSFPSSPGFSGFLSSGVPGKLGFSSLIGVSGRVGTEFYPFLFFLNQFLLYSILLQ